MPSQWMITVARILPITDAVQGMRDVVLRGWDISHTSLLCGLATSSAWTLALLTLSWILIGKKLK